MAYDVFVVSALEDRDMANLVVRRLRALKFKCWFDKKQTDTTFDPKDARNALNSQTMLVLWSKDAVQSDWVRAAASVGNSRPGMLLEIGLDDTIPYEPFSINKRHSLQGMTTRTTAPGFYEVIDELARRDGRRDLREWLSFGKDDDDKKAAWLENHPSDPLAIAEAKKRERELAASVGGAALSDAQTPSAASAVTASDATPATPDPEYENSDSSAGVIGSGYGAGVGKVPGTPGAPYIPGRKGPAGVATAPAAVTTASTAPTIAAVPTEEEDGLGRWMIAGILLGILALFLFSGIFRTSPASAQAKYVNHTEIVENGAFSSTAEIIRVVDTCPAGYISSRALAVSPETDVKKDEEE